MPWVLKSCNSGNWMCFNQSKEIKFLITKRSSRPSRDLKSNLEISRHASHTCDSTLANPNVISWQDRQPSREPRKSPGQLAVAYATCSLSSCASLSSLRAIKTAWCMCSYPLPPSVLTTLAARLYWVDIVALNGERGEYTRFVRLLPKFPGISRYSGSFQVSGSIQVFGSFHVSGPIYVLFYYVTKYL